MTMVPVDDARRREIPSGLLGPRRRGLTAPEVVVISAIICLSVAVVVMALPRRREVARLTSCRRNLMQIGTAVALYDQAQRRLPTVPRLGPDPIEAGGPLKAFLDELQVPDLTTLNDARKRTAPRPGSTPSGGNVPGIVCPSDRTEGGRDLRSPVSYRATTGDRTGGVNGGFAPGRRISLSEIEGGDGQSYTAAFSERLLGSPWLLDEPDRNYYRVPGEVGVEMIPPATSGSWRGDAGTSWAEASWRSTLYNHAMTPGAAPSSISKNGQSARMGASSGHLAGVNVLIFDGSVRTVSTTITAEVWEALATTHGEPPAPKDTSQESR